MVEYFEGILFLTTNRHEDLDKAFQSRINLTIALPDLGPQERRSIWRTLIQTNLPEEEYKKWTEGDFKELGKIGINVSCLSLLIIRQN